MNVFIEKTGKTVKSKKKSYSKAIELLKELKINPDAVLIVKNDEIILSEEPVAETDKIKLLSVVSGG